MVTNLGFSSIEYVRNLQAEIMEKARNAVSVPAVPANTGEPHERNPERYTTDAQGYIVAAPATSTAPAAPANSTGRGGSFPILPVGIAFGTVVVIGLLLSRKRDA